MNNFQQIFEKNYRMLNVEQKEAVDQSDGPVLVIAGPGTGKTQLLSTRIANILITVLQAKLLKIIAIFLSTRISKIWQII